MHHNSFFGTFCCPLCVFFSSSIFRVFPPELCCIKLVAGPCCSFPMLPALHPAPNPHSAPIPHPAPVPHPTPIPPTLFSGKAVPRKCTWSGAGPHKVTSRKTRISNWPTGPWLVYRILRTIPYRPEQVSHVRASL